MPDRINKIFKAIADPTRREIFHLLMAGSALTIHQVADNFNISRQGVTKHIKLLEEAGMVSVKKQGRERYCYADPTPLREVKTWLETYDQFWDGALDSLKNYLES